MSTLTEPGTVTIEWLEGAAAAEAPPCAASYRILGLDWPCRLPSAAHASGYCASGHRQDGWLCRDHAVQFVSLRFFTCSRCGAAVTVAALS